MTKIARHSFWVFLSRLLEGLAAMANSIVLARLLGPDGRGKYALMLAIIMLLSAFGTMGVTDSNVYLINRSKYTVNNFISNSICFAFCSSTLWFLLFVAFYELIGYRLLPTLAQHEIFLSLTVLPFVLLTVYLQNILLGIGAIKKFITTNIFLSISPLLCLSFFLVDLKLTIQDAISAYIVAYAATCLYSLVLCIKEASSFSFKPDFVLARESIAYGLKSNTGNILQTARNQLEAIMIGFFMSNASVGYYNVAAGISDKIKMFPKSVAYLLFAEVSKLKDESGDELTSKITRNLLWITTPIVFVLMGMSKYIILVLYGQEFLPARVPMSILFGSIILSTFSFPLGSLFLGKGQPKVYLSAGALGLVTTIGLDLWLIPKFGLVGAAAANLLGLLSMILLYFQVNRKQSPTPIKAFLVLKKEDLRRYAESYSKLRLTVFTILARIKK